jgi:uncharacterized protein (TIGR00297 family)
VTRIKQNWQSKLVLLIVLPFVSADLVLQTHWWAVNFWPVAVWSLSLSLLLALVVLTLRAATIEAALAGAAITASLTFSTVTFTPSAIAPYLPWHTALVPVLAVSLLAHFATKLGRGRKEQLGLAERKRGRAASQVAANLGVAALAASEFAQSWLSDTGWFSRINPELVFTVSLAALTEAAADTVSSEIGQILGGQPRMITTLRPIETGTDGAISLYGTVAGVTAAAVVAVVGTLALGGGATMFWIAGASGIFGLFFDSLLGATLERRGWLNNDAVNFLSTASAAVFALAVLASRSYLRL